jgi:hypothetical protein
VPPIKYLPLPLVAVTLFYMGIYSYLLSYLLQRCKLATATAVLLAAIVYYGALLGFNFWLYRFAPHAEDCGQEATQVTNVSTSFDQLSRFAGRLRTYIGTDYDGARLSDVTMERRSIISVFEVTSAHEASFYQDRETIRIKNDN